MAAESRIKELQSRQIELTSRGRANKGQIIEARESLSQLDSQTGKQSAKLGNLSKDTADLWKWIQANPGAFEKPVFGPPIITCSVNDPKVCDQVESLFQKGVMLSFTVQTKNDFKKLSQTAHDQLGLSELYIKQAFQDLENFRSAAPSIQDMRKFGFEGSALDCLNGPNEVLAMLCGEMRIHETGIMSKDTTPEQFKRLEQSNFSYWVSDRSSYRVVRRREYGAAGVNTSVRAIRKATIWTDQPVDQAAKQPILDRIHDLEEEIEGWKTEIDDARAKIEQERQTTRDVEADLVSQPDQ